MLLYILGGIIAFFFFSFRTMSKQEFKKSYKPLFCDIVIDNGNTVTIANFLGGAFLVLIIPFTMFFLILYVFYLIELQLK